MLILEGSRIMKEKTKQLIEECKKAGYKHLVIFCSNENVPESVQAEKQHTYWRSCKPSCKNGPHLVCASPPQRGESQGKPGNGWPKMWNIIKRLKLNFSGAGYGDCFPVDPALFADLDMGYYDLT